ncbi:hypothetical protein GFL92_01510 [Rhizobium leguminosarum bv. viciae]|nr:hypothetical protein [Rhizobium leguminosarum bv. viciae]
MQKNSSADPAPIVVKTRPLDRRYLQQLRRQQTDTAFKIADGLKASGSDGVALFRQVGISESDLAAYLKLPDVLGRFRVELEAKRVSFDVMKALINADEETRNVSLQKIFSGVRLGAEQIAAAHLTIDNREKSEFEELQLKAQDQLQQKFASRIPEAAKILHQGMANFEAAPDQDRAAAREAVIDLAALLLADFEFIHGRNWAPVEDWFLIGLTDGLHQKLSEAHFALSELASGNFKKTLPAIYPYEFMGPERFLESQIPPWFSLLAIQFLTGEPPKTTSKSRYGVRPVRRLTAIEICAGIGGQAMGLSSAGFKIAGAFDDDPVAIEVLRANRPSWRPQRIDLLSSKDQVFDLIRKSLISSNGEVAMLDLLSGALPWRIWAAGNGKAAKKEGNLLPVVEAIVRKFLPKAFLLETVKNFTAPDHAAEFNEFVSTYTELGYSVETYTPTYAAFGIMEEREKIFLIGIQHTSAKDFKLPALNRPFRPTLASAIWDLEFRHWSTYAKTPVGEDTRSNQEKRLDSWCSDWIASFKKVKSLPSFTRGLTKGLERPVKESVGMAATDANPPERKKRGPKPKPPAAKVHFLKIDKSIVRKWEKKGINVEKWDHSLPAPDNETRSLVALSPQLLKRLFGFHDDWQLFGSTELQIQQLLEATPPAVPLAIGRAIHSALTHEHIDINSLGAMSLEPLKTPRPKLPMIPLDGRDDPKRALAEAWRNGILVMKGAIPRTRVVDTDDDEDPADDYYYFDYEDHLAQLAARHGGKEVEATIKANWRLVRALNRYHARQPSK